jgi:hypothetical protein
VVLRRGNERAEVDEMAVEGDAGNGTCRCVERFQQRERVAAVTFADALARDVEERLHGQLDLP